MTWMIWGTPISGNLHICAQNMFRMISILIERKRGSHHGENMINISIDILYI